MHFLFERIRLLTEAHKTLPSYYDGELFFNTVEEIGEYAEAKRIEQGKKDKPLIEPSRNEAVDTLICAAALFFNEGGTVQELSELIDKKCVKWSSNIARRLEKREQK